MWLIDRQLDVEKYKYTSTVKLKEMAYHNKWRCHQYFAIIRTPICYIFFC
jgi:hypothetical protein